MKLYLVIIIFLSSMFATYAQSEQANIIPNPSFEQYSAMPIGWFYKGEHFTKIVKYWSSATSASPDLYGPRVRVPKHWAEKDFGNQLARTGNSMAGVTLYGCENGKPHCREYLQVQLIEPLVPKQNYYIEFWVNKLPRAIAINNLGVAFITEKIEEIIPIQLNIAPLFHQEQPITTPRHGWVKVAGYFQATSQSDYMLFGNFFEDKSTQVVDNEQTDLPYAYYYIDDFLLKKSEPILETPVVENDISTVKLEEGAVITLNNIYFDFDKYELLPRSLTELNQLVQILNDYPDMVIQINGHTDGMGTEDYNQYLSRKRAKAVVEYLGQEGIAFERMLYEGYGYKQPIASNETDDGRQLNRRVELVIVRM